MTTHARATVTLEIECKSNWSDDTAVSQVKKQAIVDAENALTKMIGNTYGVKLLSAIDIKVVIFDAK
jgi:hypothetical protein